MIRARNPEQTVNPALNISDPLTGNNQWSVAYEYDANGNLTQKTDARAIVATYTYDALNRNTLVDYSDTTPDSYRQYDLALKGKGRLNQVWQAGTTTSATYIDSYDALGRPLIRRQRYETGGVWSSSYQARRTYNLAGGVTQQIYPSEHSVDYNYDAAGRLGDKDAQNLAFTGNLGDEVSRTYSSGIIYSAMGGMAKERFGTDTPLYNKSFYNSRGQLSEIRVGTTYTGPTDGGWQRGAIINHYSAQCWGACNGTDNNGNLKQQDHWINDGSGGVAGLFVQSYSYDRLNRLERVNEGGNWQQEFVYDRWGNRTIHQTNTWGPTGGPAINKKDFIIETSTNRLYAPGDLNLSEEQRQMQYDVAGNLKKDTYTGAGDRQYDAENRMTKAWGGSNQWQEYAYNADGQRTRRKVDGLETWQVYGFDGELLAEYAANGATTSPQKEYGYRNGQLLVTTEGRKNFALAANGAVASASSIYTPGSYAPGGAISDRKGLNWGSDGGWNDAAPGNTFPDWLQVDFNGSKTIDEIDVFTLPDNFSSPSEPTEAMTFLLYGLTRFDVEYWTGSGWAIVPNGQVVGNNKIWRKITFPPLTTSKIRVRTWESVDGYSRITEVEAWESSQASFVTGKTLGALRADYTGHVGMKVTTGAQPVTVTSLGRIYVSGNTGTHMLKIVRASDNAVVASANVSMTGGTSGQFKYVSLATPVTLAASTIYYVVSTETSGGDPWHDYVSTVLTSTSVATINSGTYGDGTNWGPAGGAGNCYVPVDFQYSIAPGLRWLVSDQLGTPRMIFDYTGSLASTKRHDYLPFGEELFAGTGGRTIALGYTGDSVRQKFTLKERDIETGLDYFLARYYSSTQGRFTGVDIAGPNLSNPQSLNKYAYTLNNPLRFIDRNGLYEEDVHHHLTQALAEAAGFSRSQAWEIAMGNQMTDETPGMSPYSSIEARRNYHFTSEGQRQNLWNNFAESAAGVSSETTTLGSLGVFMHAQQDSYSHAGYGPVLGHALAGHAPDKTYNNPGKADTMALDSFNRLTTAATVLYNNKKISFLYKPLDQKTLKPLVQSFNRAKTPEEKMKIVNQIKTLARENIQRQAEEAIRKKQEEEKRKRQTQ
ncbi:MAG: RHS repeat-associated core domain-containing protein [Pyrinomonadaceae bacterium]